MLNLIKKLIPEKAKALIRKSIHAKQLKKYNGNNVSCPICGSTFRMFAPFGLKQRKNAQCHECGSLERHRLMFSFLKNEKKFFAPEKMIKVLHFAPERILYDRINEIANIDYYPCDLFPEYYNYPGKVFKMDITDIEHPDNTFDVILCSHVLEHIPDDKKAMSEMYRVMKPGGWGIFQVPIDYSREKTYEDFSITDPKERLIAFGQSDHVRWYGQDYKDRLASVNFKVTEDMYVKRFSKEDIFRYGFLENEIIYFCEKI